MQILKIVEAIWSSDLKPCPIITYIHLFSLKFQDFHYLIINKILPMRKGTPVRFYKGVTDLCTGLKANEINKIYIARVNFRSASFYIV